MTVTSKKDQNQPASSSHSKTNPRSIPVQMEEVDGLRLKLSTEDLTNPIDLEESHYVLLQAELEFDAQNLEAESWSLAVDQNYLKTLSKETIKRQDIIYELIKTEMHHVQTLKILLHVYMHELKKSQLIDAGRLERLFYGVESLLILHKHFLKCLKTRQSQSQEEGSPNSYHISCLGDILISQFSGMLGERMTECYGVFCGHNSEAMRFYKEQIQSNKRLQNLITKVGQLPLVRRLGIPECFLLVTQRITKYPILVERLLKNTEADTDEHSSLVEALGFIKETISQVNGQVKEYEKNARLQEIAQRLDQKSIGKLNGGRSIRREDLIQGHRMLLHEGTVTWKSSGKHKDIHAVLLSDVLLLLQEKDQKLVFAAVDNKPPVIALERLIVREAATEDKAMFLISACTVGLPEMYEIHTGSREERVTWMAIIRDAMTHHQEEEQFHELITTVQMFQDHLKQRDDQIKQSLTEKQQIFAALYKHVTGQETPHKGLLLLGDTTDLQQGETLLKGAIDEVENLQNLLLLRINDTDLSMDWRKAQGRQLGRADGVSVDELDLTEGDHQLQDSSEGPEQSADDETNHLSIPNHSSSSVNIPEAEVCDRVIMLAQRLYSLQAIIIQQDSQIAMQHAFQSQSQQPTQRFKNVLFEYEKQRNLDKQKEELNNLQKLQAQQREEQQRWEKEKERQMSQAETQQAELKQREEDCRKREEKLHEENTELQKLKDDYQKDLERLRESVISVEKEKERLNQEKERLEKLRSHIKPNLGRPIYDDPAQSLYSFSSFRGGIGNGGTWTPTTNPSNTLEIPPKIPPRRESISPQPHKPELPFHLLSTTNQVHKPAPVQQQIPKKLAAAKEKDKASKKKTHKRAQSAASIDMSQVLPIQVTGKEGGSLRSQRKTSPQRILNTDLFKPPTPGRNIKTAQSFSTNRRRNSDTPPPVPPPFPKEILELGLDKEIFL